MTVKLSPELEQYIAEKLSSGQFDSADAVISRALGIMQKVEAILPSAQDDLRREIYAGLRDIEEGRVSEWDPEEIKRELRQMKEGKKAV